ncbi:sodium:calcium exchanger (plasmid) [Pelagibacterium nitratireducens]|mgnify:FL=1|jgi:cation:H+ antiporter|uniref:Sodium/calcium exchanger membrane region domain-containing protein n=2 Tax=Devosiaceae TaxID=2831106 RepID=A0A918VQG7_9HYPH|nr:MULTISPECIES: sodium:calcium exchanger [Hyphomicrobiales]MBN15402.1 sodium:calcium exchanger [Pelagibacterium sp.]GHA19420.1 hypothetical protein GCM10007989_13720 [Devosia pacifica]VVT35407.1 Sodium:calcium exchanger [Hoeflea sp. EC-HK425]|tara:strand:+ start:158 stop:1159 length:1002 start_codon:yes stop_codon:yes gene_type:complete
MSTWIWAAVLLAAVFAAAWGSDHLAEPLRKLRKQWGLSAAAGGSLIGIATASPEVGVNVTSAVRGVTDIGLGAMLGSTAIGIPALVSVGYIATRKRDIPDDPGHQQHLREHLLRVDPKAATVQALPYLGILALAALLILPAPWQGLQPIDGGVLLAAYAAYAAQAFFRGREKPEQVEWSRKGIWMAVAGVGVLALGAYFTVISTQNLVQAFGISPIIGGLFITAPVAALPEIFASWKVSRSGQITPALTNIIGDHAMTMTVGFLPLALVGTQIDNFRLVWVSFVFVALMPALYAAFVRWGGSEPGFRRWQVLTLVGAYATYVAVVVVWVLELV